MRSFDNNILYYYRLHCQLGVRCFWAYDIAKYLDRIMFSLCSKTIYRTICKPKRFHCQPSAQIVFINMRTRAIASHASNEPFRTANELILDGGFINIEFFHEKLYRKQNSQFHHTFCPTDNKPQRLKLIALTILINLIK